METLMWRADVDPTMRSTVTAVELLDRAPDWDRLVAAHVWAAERVPRFRDRVSDPLAPLGSPIWVDDGPPDLAYHLRRLRLADEGPGALFELAAQLAMTPLDRARPPWEAVLVEGLRDGRAAYIIKFHHALTDGMGLAQLLSTVHSRTPEHSSEKPVAAAGRRVPAPTPTEQVLGQVRRDAGGAVRLAGAGVERLFRGVRAPRTTGRAATSYLSSARRVVAPPDVAGLPLLAGRSASWRFVAVDLGLDDLKSASRSVGGTVNDGFLAALVGAFRLYHERLGHPIERDALMPVSAPVSVRRSGDAAGGNRIAPARLAGPVGEPNPETRIRVLGAAMRAARAEPALESVDVIAPVLARMPSALVTRLGSAAMATSDLQASNVPGLAEDVYLAGARIERIFGFAPLPGCAAMISMASHGHALCVGANLDAAAVVDPALFAECLASGFDEVLALGPGGGRAQVVR